MSPLDNPSCNAVPTAKIPLMASKKDLSERDICTKYITPAITDVGWDMKSQIREEVYFTKGRIKVKGKTVERGEAKKADYILYYRANLPIAIVEAKDNNHSVRDGIQQAIVLDVWNAEQGGIEQAKVKRQERIKELNTSIDRLCERVEKTNSDKVINRYEARIEDMEQERLSLEASINKPQKLSISFETATDLVFDFIKDPSKLWHSDNLYEKRLVPKLVFTERLPYKRGAGYETATFSLLFALCKEAESDHSLVVEMPGVEPGSNVYAEGLYDHVLLSSSAQ